MSAYFLGTFLGTAALCYYAFVRGMATGELRYRASVRSAVRELGLTGDEQQQGERFLARVDSLHQEADRG